MKIKVFETDADDFEHFVGRKPKKGELADWVHYLKNGIDAQLDWDILYETAAEEFK
jgi:hypothetical protein